MGLTVISSTGLSEKQQKALILLGGSEGGKSWSDQTEFIQELVEQGFCVLSLGYFGTGGLPADLRGVPLEYFARAFHWLSTQEGLVVPNDYAVMGVSRGAELALLLGSCYPEISAVIAIAPSSVVFPGPPTGTLDALRGQHSAWSLNGHELSFRADAVFLDDAARHDHRQTNTDVRESTQELRARKKGGDSRRKNPGSDPTDLLQTGSSLAFHPHVRADRAAPA